MINTKHFPPPMLADFHDVNIVQLLLASLCKGRFNLSGWRPRVEASLYWQMYMTFFFFLRFFWQFVTLLPSHDKRLALSRFITMSQCWTHELRPWPHSGHWGKHRTHWAKDSGSPQHPTQKWSFSDWQISRKTCLSRINTILSNLKRNLVWFHYGALNVTFQLAWKLK